MLDSFTKAKVKGIKSVLVSVVDLEGSSYRKPGVSMLILEDNTMVGAVSGGCVEKEILRQAQSVFKEETPKMMTYDGRYRLGCEGILYILIEPFNPDESTLEAFEKCFQNRESLKLVSHYKKDVCSNQLMGTLAIINGDSYNLSSKQNPLINKNHSLLVFEHILQPQKQLMIFGAEHDAVQLCQLAALTGFRVVIYANATESKNQKDFPGCDSFISVSFDQLKLKPLDNQTAVVVMTHSLTQDLKCLLALQHTNPVYLGLLGASHKRELIMSKLIEYNSDIDDRFLEAIHGPAGLNIGAITPQEIAISILSEILTVFRNKTPHTLRDKTKNILA